MKLLIKVLQGKECCVEVESDTTIQEIKTKLSSELNIPVSQQKLLLVGKPLLDENPVAFYSTITDGTKLSLVVKKDGRRQLNLLRDEILKFFKKHYNEHDATFMSEKFMEYFERKIGLLSLDDLEKMALFVSETA